MAEPVSLSWVVVRWSSRRRACVFSAPHLKLRPPPPPPPPPANRLSSRSPNHPEKKKLPPLRLPSARLPWLRLVGGSWRLLGGKELPGHNVHGGHGHVLAKGRHRLMEERPSPRHHVLPPPRHHVRVHRRAYREHGRALVGGRAGGGRAEAAIREGAGPPVQLAEVRRPPRRYLRRRGRADTAGGGAVAAGLAAGFVLGVAIRHELQHSPVRLLQTAQVPRRHHGRMLLHRHVNVRRGGHVGVGRGGRRTKTGRRLGSVRMPSSLPLPLVQVEGRLIQIQGV